VDATVAEIAVATAADAVVAADAAAIKTPTWEFLAVRRRVPSADAVEKTRPFSRGLVVVNLDGLVRYKNSAKSIPNKILRDASNLSWYSILSSHGHTDPTLKPFDPPV
jgi:hypothetical protein